MNSNVVDSKTIMLRKEISIIWKKLVKKSTSGIFDPSLNNSTIELNKKLSKKNITMFLEHFLVEVKSNDKRIKDLNNIIRVIMKRKINQ
jgi:hypothetical protein